MRDMRDLWQDTFDKAIEDGKDSFLANKEADDAVTDWFAKQPDDAYDRWHDTYMPGE